MLICQENGLLTKPDQTEAVRQGENLVRHFLIEVSGAAFAGGELAEGPAGKSWERQGQGNQARLSQTHINLDEGSDFSLFTNNSALLEFPKVILLEEY